MHMEEGRVLCPGTPELAGAMVVPRPCPARAHTQLGSSLQALGMFSAALASGQLGPLMCQFGLPAEAVEAANKGGKCLCPLPSAWGESLSWQ